MGKAKAPAKKQGLAEKMRNRTRDLDAAVDKQSKGSSAKKTTKPKKKPGG